MMLAQLKACLESSEFERRLTEMEAAIKPDDAKPVFTPRIVS
jgi:hypothetical protein